MKNIISILALTLLFLAGCESFLEEENKSNVTAEEFYVTEEGYSALINANYSALREIYGDFAWLFCAGTDMYSEGRDSEPVGLSRYSNLNSSSEGVDHLYKTCFTAVQRANTAIYYASLTEPTADLDQRVAEMKALRAHAYFLLVQTYGGVPLITDLIADAIVTFDRSSAEDIYTQIVTDLTEALPVVSAGAFDGRVNQKTVQFLLAKVLLTRGYESFAGATDFADAAAYADAVIGGQALDIPFNDLWLPTNEMNAETIFSVQFDQGSTSAVQGELGNRQQNFFGSYTGGTEVAGKAPYKSYNLCPNNFALSLFEQGDERWEGTFMTTVYDRYFDYFDVEDKSTLDVAHFYAPAWYTAADKLAFTTANPDATYHDYGTYDPEGADISGNWATIIVKKFDDPKAQFGANGDKGRTSNRDVVIARLADAYLVAAEAYLQAGDATTGLAKLNVVRARANVANATAGEFDIDYILDERGRELLGEYHRWFDLKRTGKLVERAAAHHMWIEASNFVGNGGEMKVLRPIPQSALDLNQNKDFAQNPAYN
ncbi:RagB/SusD family nutrient uptake outer membrane protein [Reichenbachiella carrageenanivorans]|uniref:RagB/SusD family nutrient uptake outer membrane protein n=1 Tax=Reichenbachiella carrageenanivorans TaxID=2979869 RepID=A0ABY6D5E9_9BACT|nr:RagB/SusD family nutrient uptake outer membrane protein [Reichenbachiella carrageenanivorans]UXX81323.1 RagB/SusD family nutrient uptake outer membrane protein [Reichenbachiella carrageenanivorans]